MTLIIEQNSATFISSEIKTNVDKFRCEINNFYDTSFSRLQYPGLIAPVNNVDKIVGDGSSGSIYNHSTDDDNGTAMNQHQQTSVMEYAGSNTINDEYMMELLSANINKTFFRSSNNSIITSQVGSIVHLPCRVHLLGDEMVMKKKVIIFSVRMLLYVVSKMCF